MSAINPPPLEAQDRSRMPILNLARLDKNRKAKDILVRDEDGRQLLRQIMDGWDAFESEILPALETGAAPGGPRLPAPRRHTARCWRRPSSLPAWTP